MDVWPRIFDVDLASLLGNPSFLRQLRTLLEGYPQAPTSTAKRSTAQQVFFDGMHQWLIFVKLYWMPPIFSSHGQVNSMIMTCLSDGEYIRMSGRKAVRATWIGSTYYLLQSVTTFQSFVKNKIPDLLVVLFGVGVPDFTKQIFLSWVTLFGMLFINAVKESINFKRTESCR